MSDVSDENLGKYVDYEKLPPIFREELQKLSAILTSAKSQRDAVSASLGDSLNLLAGLKGDQKLIASQLTAIQGNLEDAMGHLHSPSDHMAGAELVLLNGSVSLKKATTSDKTGIQNAYAFVNKLEDNLSKSKSEQAAFNLITNIVEANHDYLERRHISLLCQIEKTEKAQRSAEEALRAYVETTKSLEAQMEALNPSSECLISLSKATKGLQDLQSVLLFNNGSFRNGGATEARHDAVIWAEVNRKEQDPRYISAAQVGSLEHGKGLRREQQVARP